MADHSPFGESTQKYWDKRYSLFSRFDENIKVDKLGLFSVKPEKIALHIASLLPGGRVLDAFCGVGGSAIAFARMGKKVVSVDKDIKRLEMAKSNAEVYGVSHQIEFINDDIMNVITNFTTGFDAIYLDPAWGGPDYYLRDSFTLSMFEPDGRTLVDHALLHNCPVAFTVPKNFDLNEFAALRVAFFLEWNFIDDTPLFSTVYLRCDDDKQT
jgi:trimethylguanosine synthase